MFAVKYPNLRSRTAGAFYIQRGFMTSRVVLLRESIILALHLPLYHMSRFNGPRLRRTQVTYDNVWKFYLILYFHLPQTIKFHKLNSDVNICR